VIDYLKTVAGGAQIRGLPAAELTPAVVMDLIKDPAQPGRIYHIEISSPPGSAPERWFARIGRHQSGYGVMLFAESRE
jgi:hypothetical protein